MEIPSYSGCFVCGKDNPIGLAMSFMTDGDEVVAEFAPRIEHCGYTGIVHGGVIAAALDEGMGWSGYPTTGKYYLTLSIEIKYRKPVRGGNKYLFRGRVEKMRNKSYTASGEIVDEEGTVYAEGKGKYIVVDEAPSLDRQGR